MGNGTLLVVDVKVKQPPNKQTKKQPTWQLVHGLLPLIVALAKAGAALAPHGIDLIDENDARSRPYAMRVERKGNSVAIYHKQRGGPG